MASADVLYEAGVPAAVFDPTEADTEMGPVADQPQDEKVMAAYAQRVVTPNMPFSGFGLFGIGWENGADPVDEYFDTTSVCAESSPDAGGTRC